MNPFQRDNPSWDLQTHPLLPGVLLACLAGPLSLRRDQKWEAHALAAFNHLTLPDILAHFRNLHEITKETADKILEVNKGYVSHFKELERRIPEIAETSGCFPEAVHVLARTLFGVKLLAEFHEILTPPNMSYEKTKDGTVDLLARWFEAMCKITSGIWSVFYPRQEFSLRADATSQFWVACLFRRSPEEMVTAFTGLFQRPYRERLLVLNQGYPRLSASAPQDPVADYLKNARARFNELHDTVASTVKEGLDREFKEMARIQATLELPPLVLAFYEYLIHQICHAFSGMDGSVSPRENRFIQYFLRQIHHLRLEHEVLSRQPAFKESQEELQRALQDLEELIGIKEAKAKVQQVTHFARLQQVRLSQNLPAIPTSYHSVYTGHPGTGKTTVARLMGRIFKSLGVLKKGHLIECDRSALVAEYMGQTAVKTNRVIDTALDGILFIDEAYSLAKERDEFGEEATETLLKRMEDDRDRLVVIVAGYPGKMEAFIESNPGLRSRFSRFIEFPDYTPQELCRIFALLCRKHLLTMEPALKEKLIHHFGKLHAQRSENFGNGRTARHWFESVIYAQAARLASVTAPNPDQLAQLLAEDLHSSAESEWLEHRATGLGYRLNCEHCGKRYRWTSDLQALEGVCDGCELNYNVEFGYPKQAEETNREK